MCVDLRAGDIHKLSKMVHFKARIIKSLLPLEKQSRFVSCPFPCLSIHSLLDSWSRKTLRRYSGHMRRHSSFWQQPKDSLVCISLYLGHMSSRRSTVFFDGFIEDSKWWWLRLWRLFRNPKHRLNLSFNGLLCRFQWWKCHYYWSCHCMDWSN
jgi:hypothetical protein